jgi:hypothetical protein
MTRTHAANVWHKTRLLRNPVSAGSGRHGRGLPSPRHPPRSYCCHQSPRFASFQFAATQAAHGARRSRYFFAEPSSHLPALRPAHDIKLELQWIASEKVTSEKLAPVQPAISSNPRERIIWIAALILSLALGAVAAILLHHQPPAPSMHAVINPPEKAHINLTGDNAGPPILSPDGSAIAFTATGVDGKATIWVRPAVTTKANMDKLLRWPRVRKKRSLAIPLSSYRSIFSSRLLSS